MLLVQGNRQHVESLAADGQILLLEEVSDKQLRPGKRQWALLAFGVFLFFSLTHIVPLPIAVLLGVMILLASQSLRMSEVYEIIDWRLIILIACMMSFGVAMEKTRADQYLADLIVRGTGQYGPIAVLAGFFLMTVALTQPMSNQAAALVMLPISVKTALALGIKPANVCYHGDLCGVLLFSDSSGTCLCAGLYPWTLPIFGLPESRINPDDRSICNRDLAGSCFLAAVALKSH